ncbi:MAG: nitroreductase family protein [bacterium]|nr:nitroreductase family protein [bacterium]
MPDGEGSFTPPFETSDSLDDWTNTEKVILARRSVRVYKKKQVPEELVRRVLECGRFAPSAGNCQPWRFAVIRDPKMLAEMENDIAKALTIVSKVIDVENHPWKKFHTRILQQLRPNQLHPIPMAMSAAMADGTFRALFEAPTLILLFKDKRGISNPDLDLGICGQNMIIGAHSMGLGTCWLGVVTALAYYSKWKRLFNIRHPWVLELGICMGYPVGEPLGFVHRDTQYTDWFDEDGHKVVF